MLSPVNTTVSPVILVRPPAGWMGAPQYIPLCQEHIAELQFSIIVVVEGSQAFRRVVEYVSNSGQFSPCVQSHFRVMVLSVLLHSRRAHLHIVQSTSTYTANSTIENACLKSQSAHILNSGCRCVLLLHLFVGVVVATRRLTVENRTTTPRRTALYCSLLYYRSVGPYSCTLQ